MTSRSFTQKPLGFRVKSIFRRQVTVELQPWVFVVTSDARPPQRCGLYDGERLTTLIATNLIGIEAPADLSKHATRMTRAIAGHVGVHRWRLLAKVDPVVHTVQRRVGRIAGHVPTLAEAGVFYEDRYTVRDVLTYRAAAIALAYLESEWLGTRGPRSAPVIPAEAGIQAGVGAARVRAGVGPSRPNSSVEAQLAAMTQWRGLFSPTGDPYRSLNRTLMNLPAHVPSNLVCQLNRIRLERPITDALELTMLLLRVANANPANPEARQSQLRILQHTTAAEIECAIARIAACTERKLSPRRLDDVRFVITYLSDYPEPYGGSLGGLVEHTLRWHRDIHGRRARDEIVHQLGGGDRPTARPPISLPKIAGFTFLSTVSAVVAEGARMKHCIASRASDAVAGRCFLFHVDHQGEGASVEVSPKGAIVDAQGPGNSDNQAARWGAKQLHTWAADLRRPHQRATPRKPRAARVAQQRAESRQMELPF